MGWVGFLIAPLLAACGGFMLARALARRAPAATAFAETTAPDVPPVPARGGSAAADIRERIYATARVAYEDLQQAARPSHMLDGAGFESCVEAMRTSPLSDTDLLGFYTGDVAILAICAGEALARRPIDREIRDRVLQSLNDVAPYARFFGLRAIAAGTPKNESVIGLILPVIDDSWKMPPLREMLSEFVVSRIAAGDAPQIQGIRGTLSDETCELLAGLLEPIRQPQVAAFISALAEVKAARVDTEFLRSVGMFGTEEDDCELLVEHRDLIAKRDRILEAITASPPRSVLLVGRPGTGRRSIAAAVWRRLREQGWSLFRAGHAELIAGQSYVGQIEGRMGKLFAELTRSRRTLWIASDFHSFLFAGRHAGGPTSLIDIMLPAVSEGRFPLIAITEPEGLDVMSRNKPTILGAFEVVRLDPLSEAETVVVAREWNHRRRGPPIIADDVVREAAHLAQQYLGGTAAPGNLLDLLKAVVRDRDESGIAAVTLDDLVASVSKATGLPTSVLDDRARLDVGDVSRFFSSRVIGQPEAVETLVERVAMIKAGVTDPTRPLGVFLFAGPTGTGKTEIAKAIAEYLFGSVGRLVRIDMSELQTPESLARLVGDDQRDLAGNALVDQIRRNPFSVVLLDEFEKSHPQVWDLFLQVFDDGRLTDRRGITADFRTCIIILTSNLGSAVPRGPGLGFGGGRPQLADAVGQAVVRAFRPEFINRIDRVVVFRPLSRDVLRDILHKELRDVFHRRGLRNREWAVIWDETAIAFLLDRGTTPDLGARPLKRAIERHVLAPLAKTIVEHQYPRGDQFLLVRALDERLEVEFIDPDVGAPTAEPRVAHHGLPSLATLALDPRCGDDEVPCLERHLDGLVAAVEDEAWRSRKQAALQRQREEGFWDSPARFSVFGLIEQMDRIEAGIGSATELFGRLRGGPAAGRPRFAAEHVGRLASRLFVLETAVADVVESRPLDAFVMLEAVDTGDAARAGTAGFFAKLAGMYRSWASRRGLKVETLLDEGGRGPRLLLAVSGLAAHTLLAAETGLHVLEEPGREGRGYERLQVRVRVEPQPEAPPGDGLSGFRAQALASMETPPSGPLQIVRRYRERPSPLVRDAVRGWRTGRIDRVFGGDFDLVVAAGDEVETGRAEDS